MPLSSQHGAEESAIIGASCILPGAGSVDEFWRLLQSERNTISAQPTGRWNVERFLRPGDPAPGFSYTFAGGYLEEAFVFDPAPFGISRREAQEMDPQQRLLLCATWRALEDAGLPPSSLAGQPVGVYVGASAADYQSVGAFDPAVIGSHFMTGNALSILANRISHVFDLTGPSFTVDTACSSSLVALAQATAALRAGEIELAIVGGVNMLLSPMPFIGFSQARMLSPTGLCRPFSENGDGYVRSEGAVVLVLQRLADTCVPGRRVRSIIVATGVNSDGRTNGISLPSQRAQRDLIESVYAGAGIDPELVAFVEAHGTGTKIGDPIEAAAIGEGLARRRTSPLPIGSVKSNIGHLEAASGLAGLLKASLALEHGVVPRSLFADDHHHAIDFKGLNLAPVTAALALPRSEAGLFAGICNYGFGGTNGHAVLRSASPAKIIAARPKQRRAASVLLVSAGSAEALALRAQQLADTLGADIAPEEAASVLAHQHELMPHRLALPLPPPGERAQQVREALLAFSAGSEPPLAAVAAVHGAPRRAIFVFSGNGGQYPQMGRLAYLTNPEFRQEIDEIDSLYRPLAGWSIADRLRTGIDADQLAQTSVAQALIFAVQSALGAVLARSGVQPLAVVGHSVGEIAAAECGGAITRAEALRILQIRSEHQEAVRGRGRMLVVAAGPETTRELLDAAGACDVDLAAYNSASSTTVSGPSDQIAAAAARARKLRVASVLLGIDYPFHSRALDGLGERLVADLASVDCRAGDTPFFSTVTGRRLSGTALEGGYWWDNVRQPVRFEEALGAALDAYPDAAILELSPRPVLLSAVADIARARDLQPAVLPTLSNNDPEACDPVAGTLARIAAHGLEHDRGALFGALPNTTRRLSPYPFQMEDFRFGATAEAVIAHGRLIGSKPLHPLIGARLSDGSPEWRNLIDPVSLPYLDDHRVDGALVLPAAALIEMALAAGAELMGAGGLEVGEFDISKAMTFGDNETREVATRYFEHTDVVEIWSRTRFAADGWLLHARGTLRRHQPAGGAQPQVPRAARPILSEAAEIYAAAERAGLDYGPRFRIVTSTLRDDRIGESRMQMPQGGLGALEALHILHPISLDACFHGLFLARPQRDGERKAYLPIRFRQIRIWKQGTAISHSVTQLLQESERFKTLAVFLHDAQGELVASIGAAVFRSVHLVKPFMPERTFREEAIAVAPLHLPVPGGFASDLGAGETAELRQVGLLMRAFSVALARKLSLELLPPDRGDTFERAIANGTIAPAAGGLLDLAREILTMAGGVEHGNDGTRPSPSLDMPPPEAIIGTLLQRFPRANREIRLAAQALSEAEVFLRTGRPSESPGLSAPDLWSLGTFSVPLRAAMSEALAAWTQAGGRRLRVLVSGDWNDGVMAALAACVQSGSIAVTLAAADAEHAEEQKHWAGVGQLFELLGSDPAESSLGGFDALIGFSAPLSLARGTADRALARALGQLAPGAPIVLAAPQEDPHLTFLFRAAAPQLWQEEGSPAPVEDVLARGLEAGHASEIAFRLLAESGIGLFTARAGRPAASEAPCEHLAVIAAPGGDDPRRRWGLGAGALFAQHQADGLTSWLAALPPAERATIIALPSASGSAPRERLADRVEALATTLRVLGSVDRPRRMVIVTEAARDGSSEQAAEDAAIAAFARVAINEFPEIDLRLVDIASGADAARIGEALAVEGAARELRVSEGGSELTRVRRGMLADTPLRPEERAVLHVAEGSGLDGFDWHRQARREPGPGEIEVEVAAAGLNYRDVMVALGLLDDDLLGAGLTQAALGFECSGRVARVGPGVTQHRPGDVVMGFASGAFASHVVCPDWHFFPVPDTLDLEAAATIPVVFATAWYALIERGQLRAGEDVLVHGAAGGVGLAAIQIAKLHQARVIGTASNDARRAIAQSAGADQVFDSRQERFASAVRDSIGGVDVVLNSLAGQAMLASFKLLRPFGRFLELGKRDFLDNTQLALRPFLRNIAYSGIDLDELLASNPALVRRIMAELSEAFRGGGLRPITYRAFEAYQVGLAFRSMQASEHVGKIIIRPPKAARADVAALSYSARPGLHIVVGGTSGFGLATAHWLARKGATTVALLSRSGVVDEASASLLSEMRASGTQVIVEPLDVRQADAVHDLVRRLTLAHGPVRGVVHAAVHLDDGLIANLKPERLRAVLSTKVDGILNLDAATRDQPLDYFVAYSSATTLIGSPGQAAYVAANAFLEGFMRRRRALGRPALAIGWGAISDVGILARDKQLGQRLRRSTGVVPMRAFEALAHLGRLLCLGDGIDPVQFFAGLAHGGGAEKLPLLKTAAFGDLRALDGDSRGQTEELTVTLQGKSREEAVAIVTAVLRREVAEILRMAESKVDLSRPLADLGLDSLMALELHMALEGAIGVQIAVVGAGDRNLAEMAAAIVGQLDRAERLPDEPPGPMQSTIVRLASAHSMMELSPEQATEIERIVRTSSREAAR